MVSSGSVSAIFALVVELIATADAGCVGVLESLCSK